MFPAPSPPCNCFAPWKVLNSERNCQLKEFGRTPQEHADHSSSPYVSSFCKLNEWKEKLKRIDEVSKLSEEDNNRRFVFDYERKDLAEELFRIFCDQEEIKLINQTYRTDEEKLIERKRAAQKVLEKIQNIMVERKEKMVEEKTEALLQTLRRAIEKSDERGTENCQ